MSGGRLIQYLLEIRPALSFLQGFRTSRRHCRKWLV
nr:MAG TPA: hypothetical protein [Caudoviricetes sp.]